MILTQISQQKHNENNVNLFLDNKFWCSLSKNQLIEFALYKGISISPEQKKQIEEASGENKLVEKIKKYISFRPRSEKEIRDNFVLKKGYDDEVIREIILKLKSKNPNLINDEEFAKWYTENRLNFGLHGLKKIRLELLKKGVNSKIIEQVFNDIKPTEEDNELKIEKIKKFIEKKKRTIKYKNEFELKQKLSMALVNKGFNFEDFKDLV